MSGDLQRQPLHSRSIKQQLILRPVITQDTREFIDNLLNYSYKTDIQDTVYGRFSWRKWANFYEGASKVLSGVATVVAFAAGAYDDKALSFSAGTIGTASLVCMTLASYAAKESKERTEQLNTTLDHIGVPSVPDLSHLPDTQA